MKVGRSARDGSWTVVRQGRRDRHEDGGEGQDRREQKDAGSVEVHVGAPFRPPVARGVPPMVGLSGPIVSIYELQSHDSAGRPARLQREIGQSPLERRVTMAPMAAPATRTR